MSSDLNDSSHVESSHGDPHIPPGYTLIYGIDGTPVLVPTYLVPATRLDLKKEVTRMVLNADAGEPGVSESI
jgi:hypothetical protein